MFESIDAFIPFEKEEDVNVVTEIFRRHGETVKKLEWIHDGSFIIDADNFASMLNTMPNLTKLEMKSWEVDFTNKEKQTKALKLEKLSFVAMKSCEPFLVDYFTQALPENILFELMLEDIEISNESLKKFFDTQSSIKKLNISGLFSDAEAFQNLKLTHLRCVLREKEQESSGANFLKALMNSQGELQSLDFLTDHYSFMFVDDNMFQNICKLKHLTSLKVNIDGISPGTIQGIAKLQQLKSFETRTTNESSLEKFKELSMLKKLPLESLNLNLWGFEIPAETYQQFGMNCRLKSLRIELGTWHKINFFIESFPYLETLHIRFGEANNRVEFSQVFVDEGQQHLNMRNLKLQLWGSEMIDVDMFMKLLKCFPNLEDLDVFSKFPLSSDFLQKLTCNLRKIKVLTLGQISVKNDEKFTPEIIESFKILRSKLHYCHLTLSNIQDLFFKAKNIDGFDDKFTFGPLIEVLKNDFKIQKSSMANIKVYNKLVMKAGEKTNKKDVFC